MTLYRDLLGGSWSSLAAPVRRLREAPSHEGRFVVTRGEGRLARVLCAILGLPPAGETPVRLESSPLDGGERWSRAFGDRRFETDQAARRGRLEERAGPVAIRFRLEADGGALRGGGSHDPRSLWLLGFRVFGRVRWRLLFPGRAAARACDSKGLPDEPDEPPAAHVVESVVG
jgi:hypothetical protein